MSEPDELLTEPELCAVLKIKAITARKWRAHGAGPAWLRCGGRMIRYRTSDVHAWLIAQTVRGAS